MDNSKNQFLDKQGLQEVLDYVVPKLSEDNLDYMTPEEAEALAEEVFGQTGDGPVVEQEAGEYELVNKHEIIDIDGHEVIAATINNHKYLIALKDAFQANWKSTTADISSYAPYVSVASTGGEWTFEEGRKQLMVCNFSDYYNLDSICQQIVAGCSDKGISSAATQCRAMTLGGYTWNMANFEVLNYLYKNYDELWADGGIGASNVWLPYALNANNCWKVSISGPGSSSIKCNRNGVNYSEYVIPVVIL